MDNFPQELTEEFLEEFVEKLPAEFLAVFAEGLLGEHSEKLLKQVLEESNVTFEGIYREAAVSLLRGTPGGTS